MAPSPTGWLHVGTARTALFNYLFARKNSGAFVLRIEDTDRERSRQEFESDIMTHLQWLGLSWDEFYRQSERSEIYKKYVEKLLQDGRAFYCAHTKEELEEERTMQVAAKEPPRHICSQRDQGRGEGIVRLKNTAQGAVLFSDIIRGAISFEAQLLGDISLARNIAAPLYNFTAVVDDFEMRISHVIRGEDHIPNTPKQLLIQRALGFPAPQYAHLPLLLGTDRSKLSKRHGAVSVREYRDGGYVPEALVNFLALLGWNPGDERELFTLSDLETEFSLEKVQKAGAVFNEEKLKWMNRAHIKRLAPEALADRIAPFIEHAGFKLTADTLQRIARVEQERLEVLDDSAVNAPLYQDDPAYDAELLRWKGTQEYNEIARHLTEVRRILCDTPDDTYNEIHAIMDLIMPYADQQGRGSVLWPLRVALSGRKNSPGPFEIIYVVGKEAALRRIDKALQLLEQ